MTRMDSDAIPDGGRVEICFICQTPICNDRSSYRGEPVHGDCRTQARQFDGAVETDGGPRRRSSRKIIAGARAHSGVGNQDQTCSHGVVGCAGRITISGMPCADCFLGGNGGDRA